MKKEPEIFRISMNLGVSQNESKHIYNKFPTLQVPKHESKMCIYLAKLLSVSFFPSSDCNQGYNCGIIA